MLYCKYNIHVQKASYFSHIKMLCCNQASQQNVANCKFCEMSLHAKSPMEILKVGMYQFIFLDKYQNFLYMTMYTTGIQGYFKFPWLSLST